MDYEALHAELTDDPESVGYAQVSDGDAAVLLRATRGNPIISSFMLTERTLLSVFAPTRGEELLQTLKALSQSQIEIAPILARALSWMVPSEQGIDIGLASVRGLIDTLTTVEVSAGVMVLTTAEAASIKALAESPNSRAIAIGCQGATWYDIHLARKRGSQ